MSPRKSLPVLLLLLSVLSCATTQSRKGFVPDIQTATLENGLRVYLVQDDAAPITTFQYWVNVGSADEHQGQPGITGLSHFFEHMMFRGTAKYPDYFQAVSSKGAQLNAFTWLDVTVYWEKFASEHLDFILDIESDRLANMTIDLLNLEPEREVVKSERRLRTENSASGSLGEAVGATLYQAHSYHWPTVGWMRDLNAITIEEARAYHGRFYVPNNAYIVLVGDFEPQDALQRLEKYFGGFVRGHVDRPARTPEPPQTRTRRTWVAKPTATGLLNVSYRSPAGGDPDFVVLEVIEALLTKGRNSIAQKALVYGDAPIAKSISPFLFPFTDQGVFQLELELLPNTSSWSAEERLEAVVSTLRNKRVSPDDLQRATAQLRADIVRMMSTTQSRAQLMGFSIRATGDPALPWKRLEQYGDVTPEDIQRVARRWLSPQKRVVGHAVNIGRLNQLASAVVQKWPESKELDAALTSAIRYRLDLHQWSEAKAEMASEVKAIGLLEKRAARERSSMQDKEKQAALDAYLSTADQGVSKRRAAVATMQAGLDSKKAALDATQSKLTAALSAIADSHRARFVKAILRGDLAADTPPAAAAHLGEWALHQLLHQVTMESGKQNTAEAALRPHRQSDSVLAELYDFAYTLQSIDAGEM